MICKKITGHAVKILPKGVKKATSKALGSVKNLPTKYVLSRFLRMILRRVEAGRKVRPLLAGSIFSSNMDKCRKENRFKDKGLHLVSWQGHPMERPEIGRFVSGTPGGYRSVKRQSMNLARCRDVGKYTAGNQFYLAAIDCDSQAR